MDPEIKSTLTAITSRYEKIAFLLVKDDSDALAACRFIQDEFDVDEINLNLELVKLLLPEKESRYPFLINSKIREIIDNSTSRILILRNIELLFNPSLKLNVIPALQNISRHRPIIVLWPGEYKSNNLTYATPDHPEYQRGFISGIPVLSYSKHMLTSHNGGF